MSQHTISIEKRKALYRIACNPNKGKREIHWADSLNAINGLIDKFGEDAIKIEKIKAKYKVIISFPSGKRDTRWTNSMMAIHDICAEFGISFSTVFWQPMR